MEELLYYFEITGKKEETEIANELFASLDIDYSAKTDVDKGISNFTFYSNSKEEAEHKYDIITAAIRSWHDLELELCLSKISTLKKEDWTEVWKRFFKIQHISEKVVIKASWLEYTPKPGQIIVEIDPGMSFGTGSHETTQCCLQMLEKLSIKMKNEKSLLDAGCGSGILSIAAKKLGFEPIYAFDHDHESVLASKENFERNDIKSKDINISQADIAQYKPNRQFDFVVANIISSVLTANRDNLISWVKPGGKLLLAGILRTEYDRIRNIFLDSKKITEISSYTEKEWTGALFIKNIE
jgi:ribosomal protein L11 methyltransferase